MGAVRAQGPDGIVVVAKDSGWTSHDVVAKCRGILGTRKVGHSGTLDPDATGVLVLGVGVATRLLRYLTPLPKSYEAIIRFGVETSTLDAAGEVTATHEMVGLDPSDVVTAAAGFVGDIEQIPPMVSAVKVGGRRLHELAREGIEIERAPRRVNVSRFDLHRTDDPLVYRASVDCSSGTYVRTLAADLGHKLEGGAHLIALSRTSVGGFGLDQAVALDELTVDHLLPVAAAVSSLDRIDVDEDGAAAVGVGRVLPAAALGAEGGGPWAVMGPDGTLLAVYQRHRDETVKPEMVLARR